MLWFALASNIVLITAAPAALRRCRFGKSIRQTSSRCWAAGSLRLAMFAWIMLPMTTGLDLWHSSRIPAEANRIQGAS